MSILRQVACRKPYPKVKLQNPPERRVKNAAKYVVDMPKLMTDTRLLMLLIMTILCNT